MTMTQAHSIRCGHCKGRHATIAQVHACSVPTAPVVQVPAAPEHNHPSLDPTMRMFCTPCGIVHAMAYDRAVRGYRCSLRDGVVDDCPACRAR